MSGLTASFGFPYASQFVMNGHHHTTCDTTSGQITSHTPRVCSCQFEQVLQAQQKMNSAMPLGLLPRATPSFPPEPNMIFGARDPTTAVAFSPLLRQCDVKDAGWFVNPARYEHQNFERAGSYLACHAYGDRFSPIDLNSGARRKNATRETTSTLKAWLYEHRKNPYPTKGEKIMLAILTKMTLTQVSTWFANARRRLKKENKMTWSPRNRCGERKDSEGYSDEDDDDDEVESKTEDTKKNDEKSSFRKTTVIKSPEDTPSISQPSPSPNTPISSSSEKFSRDANQDVVFPNPAEQRVLWPTGRSPGVADNNSRTQQSIEDSPVKSLRKWVDGCFDKTRTSTTQAPVTDTPPQTPPCETDRLTERFSQTMEREQRETRRKSPSPPLPCPEEQSFMDKTPESTTNREIDAALALTTLFGTRS